MDSIQILITGDLCPHNRIETLINDQRFDQIYNDFYPHLEGNDLNITNLECPLTDQPQPISKSGPNLRAGEHCIALLEKGHFNLVTLANNHIMDYGSEGVRETLELCRANGIQTVGIGSSTAEAERPYSLNIKGKRIAILNFADNEFLTAPDGSYRCNPIDPVRCMEQIRLAREHHDYLLVIVHAGNEFYELPSPRTKALYRSLVDMGADAVVSHHTHAFSGYEKYRSKPVFYGLGNFIYDWPGKINGDWNRGYVVRLTLSDQIDFEVIPLKQGNEEPGVFHLDREEHDIFNRDIERLNGIIADDEKLESRFREYCESVFPMYDAFLEPYFGKYITALRKRGLFPKLLSKRKRLLYLNLVRCESHREVLLNLLKKYE